MISQINSGLSSIELLKSDKSNQTSAQIQNQVDDTPPREDKVAMISKALSQGTYKIDIDKTAQAIAGELLG